jgi:hypothetical protein
MNADDKKMEIELTKNNVDKKGPIFERKEGFDGKKELLSKEKLEAASNSICLSLIKHNHIYQNFITI